MNHRGYIPHHRQVNGAGDLKVIISRIQPNTTKDESFQILNNDDIIKLSSSEDSDTENISLSGEDDTSATNTDVDLSELSESSESSETDEEIAPQEKHVQENGAKETKEVQIQTDPVQNVPYDTEEQFISTQPVNMMHFQQWGNNNVRGRGVSHRGPAYARFTRRNMPRQHFQKGIWEEANYQRFNDFANIQRNRRARNYFGNYRGTPYQRFSAPNNSTRRYHDRRFRGGCTPTSYHYPRINGGVSHPTKRERQTHSTPQHDHSTNRPESRSENQVSGTQRSSSSTKEQSKDARKTETKETSHENRRSSNARNYSKDRAGSSESEGNKGRHDRFFEYRKSNN